MAITVESVKSWSISVMYYILRLLLRSQKLFSSNQCMKLWDAYKTNAFLLSCMYWWVIFCKAWLRDWFSTCLNLVTLLRCCSGLWLLTHFLFGIHKYFWKY